MTYAEMFQYIGIGAPYLVFVIYACLAFKSAVDALASVKKRADKEAAVAEFHIIKTEAELFALQQKTVRETAYDAAAFAFEQTGKGRKGGKPLNGEAKRAEAVGYMLRHIDITEADAVDAVESILGKVVGEGASGGAKI